jgi:hypothetical protein
VLSLWYLASLTALMQPAPTIKNSSQASDTIPVFPQVNGSSLTRRKFSLPADFEGELNVVAIAFKRKQQEDVDTWMPYLRPLTTDHAGLKVYELPVLSRSLTLMRGVIDGGMRGGIPDSAVRATTITLYINKTPFKKALAITTEDHITVVLVDRAGTIHWRAAGVFNEAALMELTQKLAAIKNRT